ncbi:hypothetical protein SB768_30790 [Burkholderia sp. SIMBA_043]|uniref:hypothetical protein n=1 Tax=Burkholderia TaxID=32008 RepID=UPI0005D880D8|nr:hypothetical protein [Burkholderia vietnamiensis]AJY04837.1 hypothetical protein AK36_3613 [Burkholderia vietnamiensis LMG 10929]UBI23931.1 hypothetical protein LA325_08755 [Burkholderia vietnamiensis]
MSDASNGKESECVVEEETAGHRGDCPLCDKVDMALKESHIIPRFVYEWVKNSSATPYLRSSDNINERQQDGQKQYLLCNCCETRLSRLEGELSMHLFKKLANYQNQKTGTRISENIRVAVLSIFWRALYTTRNRNAEWTDEDKRAIDQFLSAAKKDLISERCGFQIYLTPMFGKPPYYGFPLNYTYILERASGNQDIRFFDEPHRFFAVFQLPFMYFHIFGGNWPEEERSAPLLLVNGDIDFRNSVSIPDVLRAYIDTTHERFEATKASMTEENRARIAQDVAKNNNVTGAEKSAERSGWRFNKTAT